MKILITGANGFLGKELYEHFKQYDITLLSRHHAPYIDLLDYSSLEKFFKDKKFDYIFHTAIIGGKRNIKDDLSVLINNLQMFKNISSFEQNYKYIFNFCSGAALKDKNNCVNNAKEEEIFSILPNEYYGLSKNIIAREAFKKDNIINFRLFGCFGNNEEESRLFKNILINIKNNNQPIIHQDKYMDYISTLDLMEVLKYYIFNNNITSLPKDLNLVYNKKMKLTEMYELIKSFTNTNLCCKILDEKTGDPYTGDGSKLSELNLKLHGLEVSLMELKKHVIG